MITVWRQLYLSIPFSHTRFQRLHLALSLSSLKPTSTGLFSFSYTVRTIRFSVITSHSSALSSATLAPSANRTRTCKIKDKKSKSQKIQAVRFKQPQTDRLLSQTKLQKFSPSIRFPSYFGAKLLNCWDPC